MTTEHILESEIQQYAIEKENCSALIIDHINSCEICRTKSDVYSLLFAQIKEQPKPVFDFNLADLVMNQLPEAKPRSIFEKTLIFTTSFFSILIAGLVIYVYRSYLSDSFSGIAPILIYLIFTTLTSLSIFLGVDMFAKYQRQMKILNFN
jgi:hypothetical protein